MDFQLGKKLFNALYGNINGYSISMKARYKASNQNRTYIYGEVVPEGFYEMIKRISPKKGEIFYDLGSGTGKAVILAALFFQFSKCIGIEILEDLYNTSKEVLTRFNHNAGISTVTDFIHSDFLEYDITDGDIFFVHGTCFPEEFMLELSKKLECIKKGARVITVTKTLTSNLLREIEHRDTNMGWGKATIYYYCRI